MFVVGQLLSGSLFLELRSCTRHGDQSLPWSHNSTSRPMWRRWDKDVWYWSLPVRRGSQLSVFNILLGWRIAAERPIYYCMHRLIWPSLHSSGFSTFVTRYCQNHLVDWHWQCDVLVPSKRDFHINVQMVIMRPGTGPLCSGWTNDCGIQDNTLHWGIKKFQLYFGYGVGRCKDVENSWNLGRTS